MYGRRGLSDYDPASGPPSWSATGGGTAATQEEFEQQVDTFRAFLRKAGLVNAEGGNTIPYGTGLPTVSQVRHAAAEVLKTQPEISTSSWQAIYSGVPNTVGTPDGRVAVAGPTFEMPQNVNVPVTKQLMTSLVEQVKSGPEAAARKDEEMQRVAPVISSDITHSDSRTLRHEELRPEEIRPVESAPSGAAPVAFATSMVRAAAQTPDQVEQRKDMTPIYVGVGALLLLLLLPKKRR